jgi:hypothetical protein
MLLSKGWFHGDITADEAKSRLNNMPAGAFLVRFSERVPGSYTISSTSNDNEVQHQRIQHDPSRGYQFRHQWYANFDDIIRGASSFYIPCPGSKYASLFDKTPIRSGYIN